MQANCYQETTSAQQDASTSTCECSTCCQFSPSGFITPCQLDLPSTTPATGYRSSGTNSYLHCFACLHCFGFTGNSCLASTPPCGQVFCLHCFGSTSTNCLTLPPAGCFGCASTAHVKSLFDFHANFPFIHCFSRMCWML